MLVGGAYYDESWGVMSLPMMTGNFLNYTAIQPGALIYHRHSELDPRKVHAQAAPTFRLLGNEIEKRPGVCAVRR